MECKICETKVATILGKPRINKSFPRIKENNYTIVRCKKCSFYYINPVIDLTQDEWVELYKDDYFENANITDWQIRLHQSEVISRIKLIKSYSTLNIDNFLDMGCGEGFVLKEALENGFKPYGLDIADNLDKSLDRTSCTFFKGNLFEANYPDNYFSAIYTDSVLEHIDKPMTILKEFYRILKPNGLVFLIVPNEDSLINDMKKILYTLLFNKSKYGRIKPFVPPYHINGFNKMSLEYAIKLNGFTVIDLAQFGGNYTFWKARRKFSKSYFFELLLYPLGLISIPLNKQIQLQTIFKK
jgi:ubiquinone/menaquinone biosynthesis C-methylase UbiE